MKRLLITICGRAGSKGFKNKNLKNFCGKPLVYYSLSAAELFIKNHPELEVDIALNTDSEDLAKLVAAEYPEVIYLPRGAELGGDRVPKVEVYKDSFARMEARTGKPYDAMIDLDITSPLRTEQDIENAFAKAQEREDLRAGIIRADAAFGGRARDDGHADGHAAAVRHGVVAAFFDRVAERVAEVQQLADGAVKLIGRDEVTLHADTRCDDVLHLCADRLCAQRVKKRLAAQHGVFDDLGAAVAVFLRREGAQRVRVAEHEARLIEAADLIFAACEVHGRLAADGGIHLRQKGCRNLNEARPAQIGAGRVPRDIADHAAAQRNHEILARDVRVNQRVIDAFKLRHTLGRFACGQNERMRLCPRQFQLRFQRIQIQRRDVFIRHNHRPPSAAHGQQRRGVFEQSVTDVDVIGARLFRRFNFYDRHRFPPWGLLGLCPRQGTEFPVPSPFHPFRE